MASKVLTFGAVAENAGLGTYPWTNVANALTTETPTELYATCSLQVGWVSRALRYSNLNLSSVPSSIQITGIKVEVNNKAGTAPPGSLTVVLTSGAKTTNKAGIGMGGYTDNWSSAGDTTDLWGQTWTRAELASMVVDVVATTSVQPITAYIDAARLTVYYNVVVSSDSSTKPATIPAHIPLTIPVGI